MLSRWINNLNLLRGHVNTERMASMQLQALVHQGGRVNGDLGPHGPVGVLQGPCPGDSLQCLPAPAEEGSAGGGEEDAPEPPWSRAALQALKNGRVLRVHRDDLRPLLRGPGPSPGRPAHTRVSLLARAMRLPAVDGGQGGAPGRQCPPGRLPPCPPGADGRRPGPPPPLPAHECPCPTGA